MRKAFLTMLAAAAVAACTDQISEPSAVSVPAPLSSVIGQSIDGAFVVVVKAGSDPTSVAAVAGVHPRYVYLSALNGFAAQLNMGQLNALQHNPNVEYVEADQEFHVDATVTAAAWGLDRIDQRALPLSTTYSYTATAASVHAYVIDTGIYTAHAEFGGRAVNVYDAFGGSGQDCHGHGTHVAGTIGGAGYGVARAVRLHGLRVLNCSGTGSTSGIIAAVDWVRANAVKPAVANLSLGGGYSSALNTAINNLANSRVFVAVAAGNSNRNACNYSPASAAAAFTTAASTKYDAKASYSNFGSCIDGYAPGSAIRSAWIGGTNATSTISGTSMASPHVAGVAALYKAVNGDTTSAAVVSWIRSNSTTGKITGNPTGTPNRLLFKASL